MATSEHIIYRIEHPETRLGPYTATHFNQGLYLNHNDDAHPDLWEDTASVALINFYTSHEDNYAHALPSREAVYTWFEGYFRRLKNFGFVLSVYKVASEDCAIGQQVVFDRAKAIHLFAEDLDNYITRDAKNGTTIV